MLIVFSPIFVADTNITFVYNFTAPLKNCKGQDGHSYFYWLEDMKPFKQKTERVYITKQIYVKNKILEARKLSMQTP